MAAGRVVVADVDGTLVGDDAALDRFAAWRAGMDDGPRLVYASGRHLGSLRQLIETTALPEPDALITAVGTEIHDAQARPWPGWVERFVGWDADAVRRVLRRFSRLQPQPAANQTSLKASYDVEGLRGPERSAIRRALAAAGLDARLVYSAGRHLDVLPAAAGKGNAASFAVGTWGIDAHEVMVFGDSGNDIDLFQRGFRGTLVANALPEILTAVGRDVYVSPHPYAAGVLDGIRHWTAA